MKLSLTTADTSQFVMGILMLVGAVLVPALLVLVWALVFRRKRKRRRRHREETNRDGAAMNPPINRVSSLPPIRKPEDLPD
jgi:hypothetical protein